MCLSNAGGFMTDKTGRVDNLGQTYAGSPVAKVVISYV